MRKMGFEESVSSETRTFRPFDGPNEAQNVCLVQNENWVLKEIEFASIWKKFFLPLSILGRLYF